MTMANKAITKAKPRSADCLQLLGSGHISDLDLLVKVNHLPVSINGEMHYHNGAAGRGSWKIEKIAIRITWHHMINQGKPTSKRPQGSARVHGGCFPENSSPADHKANRLRPHDKIALIRRYPIYGPVKGHDPCSPIN